MSRRAVLLLAPLLLALAGCPSANQSLVFIGGKTVAAKDIDERPLEILPSGAVMLGALDAAALFRTQSGGYVRQIVHNLLPLGPESRFDAGRDVKRVYAALYAMQGADFCSVVQGTFDIAAIRAAAQSRASTPSGMPLVVTRYGDYDIYTVANVGFVPLTEHTILSGNETGMRRALDRLRFGQLGKSLPGWMLELLEDPKDNAAAPETERTFALVGDLRRQAVVAAASGRLPFVAGLTMVRVLGNFRSPGLNVVGSLSYQDGAAATQGAASLAQVQQLAYLASLLTSFGFGGGQMPAMQVQQQGNDVSFATTVDGNVLQMLLSAAAEATKLSPPTAWRR